MKRLLAIPLLFLYLTAVSGVMIQIHYCNATIESWKINSLTKDCCCEGEDQDFTTNDTSEECCSDETLVYKIADEQVSAAVFSGGLLNMQTAIFAEFFFPKIDFKPVSKNLFAYQANAPPDGNWQQIPLFKLYKRYTYYG